MEIQRMDFHYRLNPLHSYFIHAINSILVHRIAVNQRFSSLLSIPRHHCLDAPKFVNDDYVLACSLENGQVLFLNNYQDQSPIHVDTELQSKEQKQFIVRSHERDD